MSTTARVPEDMRCMWNLHRAGGPTTIALRLRRSFERSMGDVSMDFGKIEKRVASMVGKGFRVCSHWSAGLKWWYVCTNMWERSVYLWKDGTLNGSTGYNSPGPGPTKEAHLAALQGAPGFWGTKAEAEAYLEEWQNEPTEECDPETEAQEPVQGTEEDGLQ